MAFVRKKVVEYKWPVAVECPTDTSGVFESQTFDATFKWIGRARYTELVDKGDLELLKEVWLGWDGIEDENGKSFAYSAANRDELLDDLAIARAVLKAFLESLNGAQAKN